MSHDDDQAKIDYNGEIKNNETALSLAIKLLAPTKDNLNVIELMIKNGADVNYLVQPEPMVCVNVDFVSK